MIRLVSDSSTLYSIEQGRQLPCDITSLCVTINGQTYREYEQINAAEFLELIQAGYIPSSSQPSIGELIEVFERYPDDEILVISMADGLSGTYRSAEAARHHCCNPQRIHVWNSRTLCGPHRYLVEQAALLIRQGLTMDEILRRLDRLADTTRSFLLPQDFAFLKRGGRCTPAAAAMGGLLRLQPVMVQSEDGTRLEKLTVGRNFNSAVKAVLSDLSRHAGERRVQISISHAFAREQAEQIADKVRQQFPYADCVIYELSCVFITQGGPQCVAIQCIDL